MFPQPAGNDSGAEPRVKPKQTTGGGPQSLN